MSYFRFAGRKIYSYQVILSLVGIAFLIAVLTGAKPPESVPLQPTSPAAKGDTDIPIWFYGVTAIVFGSLLWSIINGDARKDWHWFAKLRPIHFVFAWPILASAIATAIFLNRFPELDRSWLHHLSTGQSSTSGNLNVMAVFIPIVGPLALAIFVANMPNIVRLEEKIFRDGTKNWGNAIFRSLIFGLYHCTVGVNLASALSLGVAGLGFSWHYFKGGVERSTLVHLAYNMTGVAVIVAVLLAGLRS
jgi:hypothetical protein